ncbi:MAG: hypothetical protein JO301_07755, partial [Chitinophagaceae bacterium]|nr:hypothetical protein [Chitinophagaceae bacterium]
FVPKQIGRNICRLSVLNRSDTLQDEPVPFEVAETSAPAVLLLASSPGFEDRFLRNWLAEKNYPVITRTVVSKNKFTREYLNTRSVATDRISDALLNQVDIVVADAASMAALDANERSTLQSYLRQKRKGLILRTDNDSLRTGFHTALFALMPADSGAQQGTRLYLNDTATQLAPLHLSGTPALRAREGSKTLLTAGGRSYAASTLFGAGKIVATTLNNSFNWILAGERDSYNNVWSALFNEAMGRDKAEESWTVQPWLPAVHEPATIILQSGQQQIPQAQINGAAVYLSQNINFPFQWTGSYWPAQPGWQTGIALNGTPWYWYAFDSKDWQTARMAQTEQETQRILNKEQGTRNGGSTVTSNNFRTADSRLQTPDSKLQTVPKFWFFLLFFIPLAFLWFENKYYNR